jgi:hypothetical protein
VKHAALQAVLIIIAYATLGTACVTLAPGADQVRLTTSPGDMATCKPAGTIRVPRGPNGTVDIANAQRQFRNQVVGLGGNAGLVTSGLLGAPSEGVAYQCPSDRGS